MILSGDYVSGVYILINITIVTVHIKEHQEKLISTSRELTGIRKCKVPVAMDFFIKEVMAQ